MERAVDAVPLVVELVIVFEYLEMRQHVSERPAVVAAQKLIPMVIVLALAASIDMALTAEPPPRIAA